jgi:hypothetical protein
MIVEAEQAAHDRQGGDWNREVFPLILALREVLADCGVRPDTAAPENDREDATRGLRQVSRA